MEVKKSRFADLENLRVQAFLLGLDVVLAVLFVALEWNTSDTGWAFFEDDAELEAEMELSPLRRDKDEIPMMLPQAKQEEPVKTEELRLVDDDIELTFEPEPVERPEEKKDNETVEADKPEVVDMYDEPIDFRVVEDLPQFPGGASEFMKWLTKNLKYPASASNRKVKGKVVAQFIVNKDGSVSDLELLQKLDPSCDREVLRVLRMMPKWQAGLMDAKPCRTKVCIPVVFSFLDRIISFLKDMYKSEELLKKVNEALDGLTYDRKPSSLYEPIKYVLAIGGKRVRPVLMLLAYNLFKDDPLRIMTQAIGLETYHNFTLLHDDLMDNADMRRGHETVHRKWDPNQAILSGDTMLLQAFGRIGACEADKLQDVFNTFLVTTYEIDEGQQLDVEFETRNDVREEEYVEMIRLKTSVLLACAVKIGAILAGASKEDQENLYKFGEQIGLAFQLQDDLLDVYGDPKVFGKNIGGDITSNKKTYMLINAVNRANEAQRQELMGWIEAKDFDREEKVKAVTRLYDEIGIRQLCEQKMEACYAEAQQYLAKVSVAEERKAELKAYAASMMKRQS